MPPSLPRRCHHPAHPRDRPRQRQGHRVPRPFRGVRPKRHRTAQNHTWLIKVPFKTRTNQTTPKTTQPKSSDKTSRATRRPIALFHPTDSTANLLHHSLHTKTEYKAFFKTAGSISGCRIATRTLARRVSWTSPSRDPPKRPFGCALNRRGWFVPDRLSSSPEGDERYPPPAQDSVRVTT